MRHDRDKYNQTKGIKPKNRVFCPDCMRSKMKFDSEKEAKNFIRWNKENFNEKIPTRIYWCDACCGYHITAKPDGGVGTAVNMKLPYLTEALETDRRRVMSAVKSIYKVIDILKHPNGYYGKIGLGKCKSILNNLDYAKNPYYLEEREELSGIVEQQRQKYKEIWMKRKYCRLIKIKLYKCLCDMNEDDQTLCKWYNYELTYITHLAEQDKYDLKQLPELFLEEWETLFQASPVSKCLKDKFTIDNGTDKDNQIEENFSEGEADVPGIQVSNQGEGL